MRVCKARRARSCGALQLRVCGSLMLATCAAMLLSACGVLPSPPVPPALHDFGPPPATSGAPAPPATPAIVVVDAVTAPSWLADAQIHYRLLFDEPTRLRAYAQNLWVAPPTELLRQRLLLAFDRSGSPAPHVPSAPVDRLQLRLLDFEQVFASPTRASVSLRALVTLRSVDDRVLDRHVFSVSVASSPDVQGALQGGPEAVDRLLGQIVQWSARQPRGTPPRSSKR